MSNTADLDIIHWRLGTVNPPLRRRAMALLDSHEVRRVETLQSEETRDRFALGRLLIKVAAADKLGSVPELVRVEQSASGKPSIVEPRALGVSLSYSGRALVCAVGNCDVGVDVEQVSRCHAYLGKAARFFSAPLAELLVGQSIPEQAQIFAALWCCVEAQVKLKDTSILTERGSFALSPVPQRNRRQKAYQNHENVSLRACLLDANTMLAWATTRIAPRVRLWTATCGRATTQLGWQPTRLLEVLRILPDRQTRTHSCEPTHGH